MWLTNGGSSTLVCRAHAVRPDEVDAPDASVYKKMTTFLIEKPEGFGEVLPGLTIPGKIDKMGYKGVDTTELVMEDCATAGRRAARR
jgi:alkylation response protein AidB-like acyl-CoA dehydrogenase